MGLKNLLLGIGMFGLVGCAESQDYSFDMTALNQWQRRLFIEAGDYWNIQTQHNPNSKNKVSFKDLGDSNAQRIGEDYCLNSLCIENLTKHEIIFNLNRNWIDCSFEKEGYDFLYISKHEFGHVAEQEHSQNPNDVMFPYYYGGCK